MCSYVCRISECPGDVERSNRQSETQILQQSLQSRSDKIKKCTQLQRQVSLSGVKKADRPRRRLERFERGF